jgi:DnaK suppressor protein
MTSSNTASLSVHRERLLHERTQVLQRIAQERG